MKEANRKVGDFSERVWRAWELRRVVVMGASLAAAFVVVVVVVKEVRWEFGRVAEVWMKAVAVFWGRVGGRWRVRDPPLVKGREKLVKVQS